jgi:dTDP-4-amino-4,6-dideoxygalactose transaminase
MKRCPQDLAILGGAPAFEEMLHVGRPNIGNRDRLLERINDILDRKWLTNDGPYVKEFERRIASLTGVKHCIAMCNGTVALEIAIRAVGLTGEVIVPSMTFVATAHALQWQEITPVFCDIDSETCNIDPDRIEELITPRTSGIIAVHLWGRSCEVERLAEIAQRRDLGLIYDAAHAFGCSRNGQMIGNFGTAEIFSFHATKILNAFEGGAVVTNDDALAAKIRLMRNYGFAGVDKVIYIGINGKMNEVSAAMGLTSLESLEEFRAINQRNYKLYKAELANVPGVRVLTYDDKEQCNFQYINLEIDQSKTHVSRDRLVDILWAENVISRRYFYPGCHKMEPYRSYFPHAGLLLPNTERLVQRLLCLPTGTAINAREIEKISNIIRVAIAHGAEINKMWPRGGFKNGALPSVEIGSIV